MVLLHIGHIDIRLCIIDFKTLARHAVESGNDLLGGVSYIATRRTETEIDTTWDIQLAQLAMLIQNGTTARPSDIHHRQLRVLVGEGVAVHAAVLQLFIVTEGIHIVVLYATLLNLHVIPYLIVWFNESIG